jgi:hypothetical protein
MSIDIDALIDTYTVMKEYIPSKDRQASADHVFSILNDSGVGEQDLRQLAGVDAYMKRASAEYLDPDDEENDEDEVDYDYGDD